MKYYLFLFSVLSIVYLSKAGPLRLQKRAAFYIANETACVVDNIVYSSGDPIPTDDPCEACKCRPPGFACVLKECKVKPGCKAIRHVGHCCPEYVCGCEHSGKWYNDGEQIIDERNPCYECHCLGTSIACAFADCNFRLDCVPIYVPGKCCPDYTNCSRDNPEITPVIGDNALPPANLLPELYDPVLPEAFPADEVAETTVQSQTSTSKPESSESTDIPVVKESISDPETEGKSPEVEDVIKDIQDEKEEPKEDNTEKIGEKPQVLVNSETEIKKADEAEVTTVKEVIEDKLTESIDNRSEASTISVPEFREEEPIKTTEIDKIVESEAEETSEKPVEIAVTSTITPTTESPVKNSASQNSKSLKLLEHQTSEELVEKIELIKEEAALQITGGETEAVTSVSEEKIPIKVETDDAVVPTKAESEVVENIAEESSNDHPSIVLYSNDDKVIKKETAETVTIVVHVREKSKPPTETEDKVTEAYLTSEKPDEISVKSNDNVKGEISTESAKVEEAASTGKNFEIFPSSTEVNNVELSTSISKDPEEKIEARSESDSESLDSEEKPASDEKFDSKNNVDLAVTETTLINSEESSEIDNEAREGEIIEEIKEKEKKVAEDSKVTKKTEEDLKVTKKQGEDLEVTEISTEQKVTESPKEDSKVTEVFEKQKVTEKPENELKVTEITVEQPNIALKIKVITNYEEETPKIEESEIKEDKEIIEENKSEIKPAVEETKSNVEESKPEENVESRSDESIEEAKQENTEKIVEELNSDKVEVKTDDISENKSEERRVDDKPEEKEELKSEEVEESKSEEKIEEFKSEENVEESKPEEVKESKSSEERVEESKSEEEIVENKAEEKLEETKQEGKQEGEKSDEAKDQESVESNQSEEPKDSE